MFPNVACAGIINWHGHGAVKTLQNTANLRQIHKDTANTATTQHQHGNDTANTRQPHGKKQRRHGKATAKTLHKRTLPQPRHGKNRARHDKDMAKTWQKQEQRHSKIRATIRQSLCTDTAIHARPRLRHGKSRARQDKNTALTRHRHSEDTAKTPHQRYSATPEIRMQTSEQPKHGISVHFASARAYTSTAQRCKLQCDLVN